MKLSVIIPVFRVEDTLDRCVESVISQSVDDMEVILVDDGSPDNCGALCDKWASLDYRVKVIHKQNGGLSSARNAGLKIATGQLLTFVDSDDWIEQGTYAALLAIIGDADILEYSISNILQLSDKTYTNAEEYWIDSKVYAHTYACNKLFRRELFNDISFPEGKVFEDVYTLPLLLRRVRKVMTTSIGYYHYTVNPHGITATTGGKGLMMLLDAHLRSQMPVDDLYYMYLLNIQMDVWEYTGAPIVLFERKINTCGLNWKNKLKALLVNILGINTLCRLNKILHIVKKPSR